MWCTVIGIKTMSARAYSLRTRFRVSCQRSRQASPSCRCPSRRRTDATPVHDRAPARTVDAVPAPARRPCAGGASGGLGAQPALAPRGGAPCVYMLQQKICRRSSGSRPAPPPAPYIVVSGRAPAPRLALWLAGPSGYVAFAANTLRQPGEPVLWCYS